MAVANTIYSGNTKWVTGDVGKRMVQVYTDIEISDNETVVAAIPLRAGSESELEKDASVISLAYPKTMDAYEALQVWEDVGGDSTGEDKVYFVLTVCLLFVGRGKEPPLAGKADFWWHLMLPKRPNGVVQHHSSDAVKQIVSAFSEWLFGETGDVHDLYSHQIQDIFDNRRNAFLKAMQAITRGVITRAERMMFILSETTERISLPIVDELGSHASRALFYYLFTFSLKDFPKKYPASTFHSDWGKAIAAFDVFDKLVFQHGSYAIAQTVGGRNWGAGANIKFKGATTKTSVGASYFLWQYTVELASMSKEDWKTLVTLSQSWFPVRAPGIHMGQLSYLLPTRLFLWGEFDRDMLRGEYPDEFVDGLYDVGGSEKLLWDQAKPWADELLNDALANANYTPSGHYHVVLPEGSPLMQWNVSSVILIVNDGGEQIWAALMSGEQLGSVFRWMPERNYPFTHLIVPPDIAGWVHIHLAALWRDLRVVGKEILVTSEERNQPPSPVVLEPDRGREKKKQRRSKKMPRTRKTGAKYWGTYAMQKRIQKATHRVDGFKRNLPEGHKASAEARALARKHLILLPEDGRITYVRPHLRGKDKEMFEDGPESERLLDALGLATLLAFNDLHKDE